MRLHCEAPAEANGRISKVARPWPTRRVLTDCSSGFGRFPVTRSDSQ